MKTRNTPESTQPSRRAWRLIAAAIGMIALAGPTLAAGSSSSRTLTELLDRARIENLLTDYYAGLGPQGRDMGSFYAPDGVLDVNGIIAKGPSAIDALYKRIGAGSPLPAGKYNMLITNLKIVVHGDAATSDDIWTGVISATPASTPKFVEQGREHDTLVKRNGRWYFEHRVITSDGGLPKMFEKTYRDR